MDKREKDLEAANLELSGLASESEPDWPTRVLGWAEERNLIEGSWPLKQLEKLMEEVGELMDSVVENDSDGAKDAIGDCCVVLRIMAKQLGFHWDDCLEHAWDQIKDRKGRMVEGIFVKDAG